MNEWTITIEGKPQIIYGGANQIVETSFAPHIVNLLAEGVGVNVLGKITKAKENGVTPLVVFRYGDNTYKWPVMAGAVFGYSPKTELDLLVLQILVNDVFVRRVQAEPQLKKIIEMRNMLNEQEKRIRAWLGGWGESLLG